MINPLQPSVAFLYPPPSPPPLPHKKKKIRKPWRNRLSYRRKLEIIDSKIALNWVKKFSVAF